MIEKLWKDWSYALLMLALPVAMYFIAVKQVLPLWLGVILFALPTVGFIVGVFIALFDPLWLVSVRPSQTGPKITLDGKRNRP